MKRTTPNQAESPAPRTGTAAAGTASSSLVSHDSNPSSSRNNSSRSGSMSPSRNKKFSPGATRSREHLFRSLPMSNSVHTGHSAGYQPPVQADVTATLCTPIVGYGPRPPTAVTHLGGAPHPSPPLVHATPQSPTGQTLRAIRGNPARPVTPMIRDSFPQSAMVRPPSVAPGHSDTHASHLGPAPAPRRTSMVPTTPTGAGTSTGYRAHSTSTRPRPGPSNPPPDRGSGPRPDGATNSTTGTRGAHPSHQNRTHANPLQICPPPHPAPGPDTGATTANGQQHQPLHTHHGVGGHDGHTRGAPAPPIAKTTEPPKTQPPRHTAPRPSTAAIPAVRHRRRHPHTRPGDGRATWPSGPTTGALTRPATPHGDHHGPGATTRPVPRTRLQGTPHDPATQVICPDSHPGRRS